MRSGSVVASEPIDLGRCLDERAGVGMERPSGWPSAARGVGDVVEQDDQRGPASIRERRRCPGSVGAARGRVAIAPTRRSPRTGRRRRASCSSRRSLDRDVHGIGSGPSSSAGMGGVHLGQAESAPGQLVAKSSPCGKPVAELRALVARSGRSRRGSCVGIAAGPVVGVVHRIGTVPIEARGNASPGRRSDGRRSGRDTVTVLNDAVLCPSTQARAPRIDSAPRRGTRYRRPSSRELRRSAPECPVAAVRVIDYPAVRTDRTARHHRVSMRDRKGCW